MSFPVIDSGQTILERYRRTAGCRYNIYCTIITRSLRDTRLDTKFVTRCEQNGRRNDNSIILWATIE